MKPGQLLNRYIRITQKPHLRIQHRVHKTVIVDRDLHDGVDGGSTLLHRAVTSCWRERLVMSHCRGNPFLVTGWRD